MDTDQVEIRLGLPQRHQHQAVGLYYDAFARKLAPLVSARDRGVALVEKIIDPIFRIAGFSALTLMSKKIT